MNISPKINIVCNKEKEGSIDDFGTNIQKYDEYKEKIIIASTGTVYSKEEEEENIKIGNFSQWSVRGNGNFVPVGKTIPKLNAGVYEIRDSDNGPYFNEIYIDTDEIVNFSDYITDDVMKEIEKFWNLESKFKEYKFLHRRGFLLYGPAGTGKSMLVKLIMKGIIGRDGLVINCNKSPALIIEGLRQLRQIEPTRNVVCIYEDLDAIIGRYGEDELLSLLDGEAQLDKILNIATTNYPEKLDARIISRPRRFDRLIYMGMPGKSVRREFFEKKLNINEKDDLDKWIEASEGFTFAAMAELVVSVKCLLNDFDSTVDKIKKLTNSKVSSDSFNRSNMGFMNN